MGELLTMYTPQNNSPYTTLEEAIGAGETSVTVADASVLPDAPNLLTIGTEENAEVVLMTAKTGNIRDYGRGVGKGRADLPRDHRQGSGRPAG